MTNEDVDFLEHVMRLKGIKVYWKSAPNHLIGIHSIDRTHGLIAIMEHAEGHRIDLTHYGLTDIAVYNEAGESRPSPRMVVQALRHILYNELGVSRDKVGEWIRASMEPTIAARLHEVFGNMPDIRKKALEHVEPAVRRIVTNVIADKILDELHVSLHVAPTPKERTRAIDLEKPNEVPRSN